MYILYCYLASYRLDNDSQATGKGNRTEFKIIK